MQKDGVTDQSALPVPTESGVPASPTETTRDNTNNPSGTNLADNPAPSHFAITQATRTDPFDPAQDTQGHWQALTDRLETGTVLQRVRDGGGLSPSNTIARVAQPGDILVCTNSTTPFSGTGTHHTGIYLGNGYYLNAITDDHPVTDCDTPAPS